VAGLPAGYSHGEEQVSDYELIQDGTVTSPGGFTAGAVACGLKGSGNLDLTVLYSESDCTAAGVFTRNQVAAAPVILDRETLAASRTGLRGVVSNAGIANACTGEQGMAAACEIQAEAAALLSCRPEQLLLLSTGLIGEQLPVPKIVAGLRIVTRKLSTNGGREAAQAIMTTDTRPKHLAVIVQLPGGPVTIGAMAKGAAMIHPNMATMLAVITTDAAVPAGALQPLLREAVDESFNCISVDGDTSTNDTVLLLANGSSGVAVEDDQSNALFGEALNRVCLELAHMIVRDGEGATKFVTIRVTGADKANQAKAIAGTIATSPLVKTALAGGDPNWGRILAAAGRAGVAFDQSQVDLWVGDHGERRLQLVSKGSSTAYLEEEAVAIFAEAEIDIHLDLSTGETQSVMWTTDLTHEYITLNADYHT
jgi:glutamate N-acetyltransferase/amino-acid N-acetyltransferase